MQDSSLVDKKVLIKRLYNERYRHVQISRLLNISCSRVSHVLLKEGIKTRPGRITKEMADDLVFLYNNGASMANIAEFYNISQSAVRKHLKLGGCNLPNNRVSAEDLKLILYYRSIGINKAEIARIMKRNVQTITKHLKEYEEGNQYVDEQRRII